MPDAYRSLDLRQGGAGEKSRVGDPGTRARQARDCDGICAVSMHGQAARNAQVVRAPSTDKIGLSGANKA